MSNKGRVRRKAKNGGYRHMKPYTGSSGHFQVGFRRDGVRVAQPLVHQLIAAAFIGPCPEGKQVNHKDGRKKNNHKSNLEYVTSQENTVHAGKMGFLGKAKGEGHGRAKLKESDVLEIRLRGMGSESFNQIAKDYGVSHMCIANIIARKNWKHLDS